MPEETTVEKAWRGILEGAATARLGCPEVISAAYAEPRLRALFRFPSHGCLTFHRNTEFPWRNDLPFIAGDAPCSVYTPRYAELLGEGLTPKAAAALVVAHLPLNCGAAVNGTWPTPVSRTD
ncbi:DUF6193 family natural product biosynthesis protein [Streptomyces niveus]|uniref:DUF6193 family natural product biosynthesis protein n=1 Tax=Streptomyces niveus TaxID=193462 RepID=UPI00387049D1